MDKKNKNNKDKYFEAVGRRKTAVARVRITESIKNNFIINDQKIDSYLKTVELQTIANEPFTKTKISNKFSVTALIKGGGYHSQVEALRHGISRALIKFNSELRGGLKKEGLLKRDPRMKERKKFGLKKARKAAQWSKR